MLAAALSKWRTSVLIAAAFCTLILILSQSASRFRFSGWADQVKIDISGQHEYQEPVILGGPVHVPVPQASDSKPGKKTPEVSVAHSKPFQKPSQRIVAMVFAGRKEYVSILDCYLQRNLVRNGGLLDEVMWIMHVNRTADIVYLHDLVDNVPEYTRHEIYAQQEDALKPFRDGYKLCKPNTYYVKIDDDVVFMEDNAIEAIIQRKIDHREYLIVSANVLNPPGLSWVHYHLNTSKPYLPELQKPVNFVDDDRRFMVDWRPSTLPSWDGPKYHNFSMSSPAPFDGHRWLPLRGGDIEKTPLGALGEPKGSQYAKNGSGYVSWTVAAQLHYSFLDNLENGELARYKFDLWNYHNESRSINFVAFSGDDVVANPVQGEDDIWWTSTLPSKLRRPAVLDGRAMVVHFGTQPQTYTHGGTPGRGLRDTDLLRRYRSYANEFICGKPLGSRML